MFLLGRVPDGRLDGLLATAHAAPPTYREIGATLQGTLPDGYSHVRRSIVVGATRAAFDRGRDGLRTWGMHTGSGFTLYPDEPALSIDGTVLVLLRMGPLVAVAPCRIVRVVDEQNRFGFAYGTLPGHPERGEEAFVVEHVADGEVTFTVTAFSRPVELLPRLGGPVTRLVQQRATRAYLRSMARIAEGS